jgi:hypothetical protein
MSLAVASLLLVFLGASDTKGTPVNPETPDQGCDALIKRVYEAKLFPRIEKHCFFCELESDDGHAWEFALRWNKAECGGNDASTLFDRYLVMQRSPVILWYDTGDDRYLSWEAAVAYHRRHGAPGASSK